MLARSTATILSVLTLAASARACERTGVGAVRDTAVVARPAPVAVPAPPPQVAVSTLQAAPELESTEDTPGDSDIVEAAPPPIFPRDSVLLRRAVEAFAARSLYQHWAPDPADDGHDHVCHDPNEDGVYMQAAWGVARARVTRVAFTDTTGARAEARVEVVRVLSIEGHPGTSDGMYAQADVVIIKAFPETIELGLRRRRDGRWIQCDLYALDENVLSPISLTGPPADTLAPRGQRVTHIGPAGATWKRVHELADSVARAEPR